MASNTIGLFSSPEEIRRENNNQAQLRDIAVAQAPLATSERLLFGQAGRATGDVANSLMGRVSPQEAKAKAMQEVQANVKRRGLRLETDREAFLAGTIEEMGKFGSLLGNEQLAVSQVLENAKAKKQATQVELAKLGFQKQRADAVVKNAETKARRESAQRLSDRWKNEIARAEVEIDRLRVRLEAAKTDTARKNIESQIEKRQADVSNRQRELDRLEERLAFDKTDAQAKRTQEANELNQQKHEFKELEGFRAADIALKNAKAKEAIAKARLAEAEAADPTFGKSSSDPEVASRRVRKALVDFTRTGDRGAILSAQVLADTLAKKSSVGLSDATKATHQQKKSQIMEFMDFINDKDSKNILGILRSTDGQIPQGLLPEVQGAIRGFGEQIQKSTDDWTIPKEAADLVGKTIKSFSGRTTAEDARKAWLELLVVKTALVVSGAGFRGGTSQLTKTQLDVARRMLQLNSPIVGTSREAFETALDMVIKDSLNRLGHIEASIRETRTRILNQHAPPGGDFKVANNPKGGGIFLFYKPPNQSIYHPIMEQ